MSLRCSHIAESLCKRGYYKGVAIEMFSYGMMHLVWASLFPSDFKMYIKVIIFLTLSAETHN